MMERNLKFQVIRERVAEISQGRWHWAEGIAHAKALRWSLLGRVRTGG